MRQYINNIKWRKSTNNYIFISNCQFILVCITFGLESYFRLIRWYRYSDFLAFWIYIVVNVWQKQRKSQIQIMASSYTRMSGFGKMKIKNWSIIAMIEENC